MDTFFHRIEEFIDELVLEFQGDPNVKQFEPETLKYMFQETWRKHFLYKKRAIIDGDDKEEKKIEITLKTTPISVKTQSCIAIPKNGPNKDKPCGRTISKLSKTERFCGYHYKKGESQDTTITTVVRDEEIDGLIIMKDKHNNFVYGSTRLVFKSNSEQYIIGKLNDKDDLESLTDEDIKICKQYGLKFKRNAVAKELPRKKIASTVSHTAQMDLYN